MAPRSVNIEVFQNTGALLGLGTNQIVGFSDYQVPRAATLAFDDSDGDFNWDFSEDATATLAVSGTPGTNPADLVASGTVRAGITLPLLGTIGLGTPVNVAVVNAGGAQYVRFFNSDGTSADPSLLLDGVLSQIVNSPLLGTVLTILGVPDIVAYVESNLLLTYTLNTTSGMAITCFTSDTLIITRDGPVRASSIQIGDLLLTLDSGYQPVRWRGEHRLSTASLIGHPRLRPIRFQPGSLGEGVPHQAMTVSPQHRCLMRTPVAANMTGSLEVLVPAKHLVGLPGVEVVNDLQAVTYIHFLLDRHEVIYSDGAPTETLYLGPMAVEGFSEQARVEIEALYPESKSLSVAMPAPARPILDGRRTRKLVERALKNGKQMVEGFNHPIVT